jgi:large repetitive protein
VTPRGAGRSRRTMALSALLVGLATVGSSLVLTAGGGLPGAGARSSAPGAVGLASTLTVAISSNPAPIDAGQSVTLTATASGGTGPYTAYAWYAGTFSTCSGDSQVSGQTGTTYTITGLSSNEYVCASATDSENPPATAVSAADLITVNPALTVGTVTPASPTIDSGRSVMLAAGAAGGTGPLAFQWSSGPSPAACTQNTISGATSSTLVVSPTATTDYCYTVSDHSVGSPVQGGTSAADAVTVDLALGAGPPTPSGLYGDSGQSFTLKSAPSGGTGVYFYQWYSSTSSSCTAGQTALGTASSQTVAPTASTYYCYALTDSSTDTATAVSATTEVFINATLTAGAISPATPAIDSGTPESVVLTASPSGGALAPPSRVYTYQWYSGSFANCTGDTNAIAGATSIRYTAQPTTSTYYCYQVTDANNTHARSGSVLLTVDPPLVPGTPSPASAAIDVGRAVGLTVTPMGGAKPYSFQWFAGTSCTSGDLIPGATSATFNASAAGSYVVRVTDVSNGTLALGQRSECSGVASVTMNSAPNPSAPVASATAIDSGQSVGLTGSASGGTPVLTFQWLSGPASSSSSKNCTSDTEISGATSASLTVSPPASTYYCYVVSDGSSDPPLDFSSTVLITVNGAPSAGAITAFGSPAIDAGAGETVTLSAHATGGTGTLSYQWYSGTSAVCSSDTTPVGTNSPTYTTPGGLASSLDYCYTVTDAASPPVRAATSAGFLVTVDAPIDAVAPAASAPNLDVGQSLTLTASPTGGDQPFLFFQWFTGNASCGALSLIAGATSSTVTVAPSASGTADYCYRVTDSSNGNPVQASGYSATPAAVAVFGTLTAGPVSCFDVTASATCAPVVHGGDHVALSAAPTGGDSATYSFTWYTGTSTVCASDTTKVVGQTNQTLAVVASASPGLYYCYAVTDGPRGESASSPTYYLDPAASGGGSGTPAGVVASATARPA